MIMPFAATACLALLPVLAYLAGARAQGGRLWGMVRSAVGSGIGLGLAAVPFLAARALAPDQGAPFLLVLALFVGPLVSLIGYPFLILLMTPVNPGREVPPPRRTRQAWVAGGLGLALGLLALLGGAGLARAVGLALVAPCLWLGWQAYAGLLRANRA